MNIVRGHKGGIGVPNSALGLSFKESEANPLKQKKKSSNGRTLARLLHGSWRYFIACIAASLLFTAFELVIPQIIRVSVDSLIGEAPVKSAAARPIVAALGGAAYLRQNLWLPAAFMAGLGLLSAIMRYCVNIYSSKAGETLVKTSRDLLYHHIQHLPWKWHMQNPTGDIIQRCTSDVDVIRQFVCNQLVEVVRTVFLIVLYLCIMFTMNLRLSLISALFIPIVGLSSGVFYKKISGRFQAADEAEGDLTTCAQENLTAVRVVRASFYEEDALTHRDLLGSLMALGLTRETLGDILVFPRWADVLATAPAAELLLSDWTDAGRVRLHTVPLPLAQLTPPQEKTKEIRDTVSSLRLDSVLAVGFSLSRGKAAEAVTSGKVQVNWTDCQKPDRPVAQGDTLTLRGLGKCVLEEVGHQTKKGRVFVTLKRYL